ncbi:MAG: hypothetical protein NDI77_01540 [Geobacteraceae bacterium]|nr:hypothetical protein [Geobacteraceae bacterium]
MTLLINQIHVDAEKNDHFWIAAADEWLSNSKGFHSIKRKIFPFKRLNCCISYFGLAAYKINGKDIYIGDLIQKFIANDSLSQTIRDFSCNIKTHLNSKVPNTVLSQEGSGFHICGFESNGLPVLYHFSNISGMNDIFYGTNSSTYNDVTEDFIGRDANNFGYDPNNLTFSKSGTFEYRNGDLSIHVNLSKDLLSTLKKIPEYGNYVILKGPYHYAKMIDMLYKIIIKIQKEWAKKQRIGGKNTILIIKKTGIEVKKRGKWSRL